jgi:uncharacterized protein (DUF1330 family)
MTVRLCVLLWSYPGTETALSAYEDQVLELMADHGARVLQRARTDGSNGAPVEIQMLEYPSREALDAYISDERRAALVDVRDAAIAHTDIIPIELL